MADQAQTVEQIVTGWNDRLGQLADALTEAAKHYGPDAVNLAFGAARVSCMGGLLVGAGMAVVAAISGGIVCKHIQTTARKRGDRYEFTDNNPAIVIGVAAGALIAAVGAAINLLDIWNWAGALYPQLYIAHKLLNL